MANALSRRAVVAELAIREYRLVGTLGQYQVDTKESGDRIEYIYGI